MLYIYAIYLGKTFEVTCPDTTLVAAIGQSVMDANKHPSSHLLKQCSKC